MGISFEIGDVVKLKMNLKKQKADSGDPTVVVVAGLPSGLVSVVSLESPLKHSQLTVPPQFLEKIEPPQIKQSILDRVGADD